MTPEFQALYAEHHNKAVAQGFLTSEWDNTEKKFDEYLAQSGLSEDEQLALLDRFKMQHKLGSNTHYEGNGLTKNLMGNQQYGVVETFNFERKEISLDQLAQADAIRLEKIG